MEQLVNDSHNNLNPINFSNSVLLDNLIGSLSIHCPHSKQAKQEYLTNDDTKTNDTDSGFEEEHNESYCKWNGSINDYLLNHCNKCDHIGVSCPLQMIGCKADNLIQMDIPKHFNNYNLQHLIILGKKLHDCQQTILQQNQRVKCGFDFVYVY